MDVQGFVWVIPRLYLLFYCFACHKRCRLFRLREDSPL